MATTSGQNPTSAGLFIINQFIGCCCSLDSCSPDGHNESHHIFHVMHGPFIIYNMLQSFIPEVTQAGLYIYIFIGYMELTV